MPLSRQQPDDLGIEEDGPEDMAPDDMAPDDMAPDELIGTSDANPASDADIASIMVNISCNYGIMWYLIGISILAVSILKTF